ncbi:MAG: exodeoxyribonuclease VII large subunit [Dechloromonas sp.]|nr:exodeoxyribonuclease VII large subunit [Dechloromonas sp.]
MSDHEPFVPGNPVLSVSSLNRLVHDCLESAFPLTWVGGEISNLTFAASGHVYFSLKDANAQVRCAMWRNRAQLLGWRPENGQQVEARAQVSFYEPRGEFQLSVETIRRAGRGDLFERFLRLRARLEADGLFAAEIKRPLPEHPRALAIVTSLQAAALHDVLTTLRRRAPHVRSDLYPTPVQGEGAAEKIAAALQIAGAGDCDAIILCRGGGSIEDLWPFNEEVVARAIRASQIPVVAGIGHETDFTIADFAADLRAATPTAAAEILSPDREALLAHLQQFRRRITRQIARGLGERAQQLDSLAARLTDPTERLRQRRESIVRLGAQLDRARDNLLGIRRHTLETLGCRLHSARPQPQHARDTLKHLRHRIDQATRQQISGSAGKLMALRASLIQMDPRAVLKRGYALAIGPDGRAVRDSSKLSPGDSLRLGFARGSAAVTVNQVVAAPEAD